MGTTGIGAKVVVQFIGKEVGLLHTAEFLRCRSLGVGRSHLGGGSVAGSNVQDKLGLDGVAALVKVGVVHNLCLPVAGSQSDNCAHEGEFEKLVHK